MLINFLSQKIFGIQNLLNVFFHPPLKKKAERVDYYGKNIICQKTKYE